MELEEFFNYKNELMKTLCCKKEIVELVLNQNNVTVPNHDLPYSRVFPFEFIPDTIETGGTYVCFDSDVVDVQNKTFLYPVIYVWIYTHKSNLRVPDGRIRLDALASEINKELNGSRFFGLGELYLKRVDRFVPIKEYQGRCLTYYAKEFNMSNTPRRVPQNRRLGR